MEKKYKALDLFCGLGGWSDGLALEGFECLGVEIELKIAKLYKHKVIIADVRSVDGSKFKGFDLIVGSPPCRDFTQLPDHSITRKGIKREWIRPKDPEQGLILVNAFLKFVDDAKPQFWLMENVKGLKKYIGAPRVESHLSYTDKGFKGMFRCFWGNFPHFLIYRGITQGKTRLSALNRSWERARIPLPISRGLGRTLRSVLE